MKLLLPLATCLAAILLGAAQPKPKPPPPQMCQPYAEKCPACKDCTQCKHCSVDKGRCSVCFNK